MRDFLLGKSQVLTEEALVLKQENFVDNRAFLSMHEKDDLRIFLEVKEELNEIKRVAALRLIDVALAKLVGVYGQGGQAVLSGNSQADGAKLFNGTEIAAEVGCFCKKGEK